MQWDIFCKVIDNHGDIGVCWRLCRELAARGARARLWVDDARALAWMAPDGPPSGVQVLPWGTPLTLAPDFIPGDVLVEAFGCDPAAEFVAAYAQRLRRSGAHAAWLNLEYLSAEAYVARSHKLPSPVTQGPGAGLTKHFFYPGFSAATGGLLREASLDARRRRFDAAAWRQRHGVPANALAVSLFCYEPPALPALLQQLAALPQACHLLATPGRAQQAVRAAVGCGPVASGQLKIQYLPYVSQDDFDELLWACDLNFVRGEDSLVRALWAGQPLVWQLYPQHDGAHQPKLQAFMDAVAMPAGLRALHQAWNADSPQVLPALDLPAWRAWAAQASQQLRAVPELAASLTEFVQSLLRS